MKRWVLFLVVIGLIVTIALSGCLFRDIVINPATQYCRDLGYDYFVEIDSSGGEIGYCKFPNGEICEEWDFFAGKCGQNWTYCVKTGGRIADTPTNCSVSQECAVCILPDGTRCVEWDYFLGLCPYKGEVFENITETTTTSLLPIDFSLDNKLLIVLIGMILLGLFLLTRG